MISRCALVAIPHARRKREYGTRGGHKRKEKTCRFDRGAAHEKSKMGTSRPSAGQNSRRQIAEEAGQYVREFLSSYLTCSLVVWKERLDVPIQQAKQTNNKSRERTPYN